MKCFISTKKRDCMLIPAGSEGKYFCYRFWSPLKMAWSCMAIRRPVICPGCKKEIKHIAKAIKDSGSFDLYHKKCFKKYEKGKDIILIDDLVSEK